MLEAITFFGVVSFLKTYLDNSLETSCIEIQSSYSPFLNVGEIPGFLEKSGAILEI